MSAEHLYKVVNQNNPEMDNHVFKKIIIHMDKDITDYEIKFLFKSFDADGSGKISC